MTRVFLDGFALRFPRTGIVNYIYNVAARLNDDPRLDLTLLLKDLDFADQEYRQAPAPIKRFGE
jgi:hypothetical protein